MERKLTILDFSVYENPIDPKSDALLQKAAESAGVTTRIFKYSRDVIPEVDSELVWLRYDIRSRDDFKWILEVAAVLKRKERIVFPSPKSIWLAEDKWETYLEMKKAGIPLPMTFRSKDLLKCGFPAILKTRVGWGSMGNRVVLEEKAMSSLSPYRKDDYICQRFIPHEKTLIIALAGGIEIACLEDYGKTAFEEEKVIPIKTPHNALELAQGALKATGLCAGTVDLIDTPEGFKVLEVNSAPRISYPHIPELDLAKPMVQTVLKEWGPE